MSTTRFCNKTWIKVNCPLYWKQHQKWKMIDFVALKIVTGKDTTTFHFINWASRCKMKYNVLQTTTRNISWMKKKEAGYLMMSHHLLNVLHPHRHGHISETTWTWTFDNFPSRESYIGGQYSLMINVYLSFLAVLPSQLPKTLLWTKSWRKHSAIETILDHVFDKRCLQQYLRLTVTSLVLEAQLPAECLLEP